MKFSANIENLRKKIKISNLMVIFFYLLSLLAISSYFFIFNAEADSLNDSNPDMNCNSFNSFSDSEKSVLILNSYARGLKWTDEINNAIEKKMRAVFKHPEIYYEYMDTKRNFGGGYIQNFFEFFKTRYSNKKIEVVITTDDDAFNFTQRYRDEFFKNIPIVFCGVNFFDESKIKNKDLVTGIVETINIRDNILLAKKFNEKLKKIVFISDNTTTGIANKKAIKALEPEFKNKIEFLIYGDSTIDNLAKKVTVLEDDSAIIFLTYSQDSEGKYFSLEESLDYISLKSSVPVYCVWDFYLDYKVVGGKLISGSTQGEMAASCAVEILKGKSVSSIPVQKTSPYNYVFNYKQLKTYDINENLLPEGSVIINAPVSLYSQYKMYFLVALIVLTLLTVIIILLIINIYKRKYAESELLSAKDDLENRVEERTAELKFSLNKLQDEISKRHKVEQILDESETRYKTLTENIYDLIIETDSAGLCLYVSPNYNEITGYFPDELLGKNFLDLIHHEDITRLTFEFSGLFQFSGKTIHDLTIKMKAKNGGYNIFEINAKTYQTSFNETRAVIVLREITLRKKTDEEMLKATKLESVGVLAGGIAHDFNNILMGVVGNLSLAKKRVAKDEKTYEILTRAEKVAFKAKALTEQLITFSKGGFPIKKITAVSDLVKESIKFALTGSNIVCKFIIDDNISQVEVDEGQIAQVITNLAINAKQAMPDGGSIDVTIKNVVTGNADVFSLNAGNYVKISIKDTGIGIAPENLKKIFDPYYTTKPTGNGLGLATVYSIIKNHGGAVTVESEIKAGTVFSIYLPESRALIVNESDFKGNGIQNDNFILNILLMDEDEIILKVTEQMLVNSGHKVTLTRNYDDLITEFNKAAGKKEVRYNIVILNCFDREGNDVKIIEAMSALKSINPDVIVIIAGSNPDSNMLLNYKDYGFKACIVKPYQQQDLQNLLISLWKKH